MKVKKTSTTLEQLLQVSETPIWDGDLISKEISKKLESKYLVAKMSGFTFITAKGIEYLINLDLIIY